MLTRRRCKSNQNGYHFVEPLYSVLAMIVRAPGESFQEVEALHVDVHPVWVI